MISSSASFCQKQTPKHDEERGDADDQPRAQLVEVLDEAQAVVVPTGRSAALAMRRSGRARRYGAPLGDDLALERRLLALGTAERGLGLRRLVVGVARSSSSSSSRPPLPVIESLNSRIPPPSCLPRPGRRLGPKIRSTITRTMISSVGPMLGHRETPLVVGR